MFPAQTSFIPVTVALAKFIESDGFGGLFPFWYLGTTPVKYLIGPVVPGILVGLHKILPQLSLFDLSYFILITSHIALALGWGMLAWRLSSQRRIGVLVGIISLFLPWHWFSAFGLSEVSAVLAQALTPWVLLASARIFNFKFLIFNENFKLQISNLRLWLPSLAFALLLLTNSTAAIPAIVGLILLSVLGFRLSESSQSVGRSVGFETEKRKTGKLKSENRQLRTDNLENRLKRAILVILLGGVLSTFWYGIDYWLTIFGAPSVGGKSLGGAFVTLLNSLRSILPILLAIVIVFFGTKPKNIYQKFTILWLTVFVSVTLIRFMADVDFWMDWTSWMGEVEIGLVLLLASLFQSSKFKVQSSKLLEWLPSLIRSKLAIYYLPFTIYIFVGWGLAWQNRDFWLPRKNIEGSVEFKIANWLEVNVGQFRGSTPDLGVEPLQDFDKPIVFLSGTTAFWLNSLVDVKQVRGGRDETSVDQSWRQAVWEIREGVTAEGTERVLKANNINFVVVHTDRSGEFYHDFKNSQKFEDVSNLVKIYDEGGDVIYKLYK